METITQIAIDQLHESPFNPRKVFNEASLQELATDIASQGRVLSPLLVRPRVPPLLAGDPDATTGYEIVFGHRRFRAAQLAHLVDVPCMVRSMTDEEVKKAQISENLQREDVHPIEEAEGFQALIDGHNMTADMLVEQTGKSRSYVYGRLKLLGASPEVRKLCLAGEMDPEVTLLIARLGSVEKQQQAIEFIRKDYRYSSDLGNGGKQSYRHLRSLLNEKFTLDLRGAIFDIKDELLIPLAGNCMRCPKRTGNAPEFDDVANPDMSRNKRGGRDHSVAHEGADVCTDAMCFDAKKKAHLKREAAALEAKGKTVVQGGKARQAIDASGSLKNGYVKLSDVKAELAKAPKSANVAIVTIQNPRDGKTVQAVKVDDMKAAGVKVKAAPAKNNHEAERLKREAQHQRNEAAAKAETAYRAVLLDRVRAAASIVPRSEFDLQMVARRAFMGVSWRDKEVITELYDAKSEGQLEKLIDKLDLAKLALFLLDCAIVERMRVDAYSLSSKPEALLAAAKHYGIDPDMVRAELAKPASTPSPAARAPKKAKAGAGAKKGKAARAALEGEEQGEEQKDDAGVAGGSDAEVGALEEA